VLTTIQTAWHVRFSFQHQENDTRFATYLNVGLSKPKRAAADLKPAIFE
jgi:hypothetical protein